MHTQHTYIMFVYVHMYIKIDQIYFFNNKTKCQGEYSGRAITMAEI